MTSYLAVTVAAVSGCLCLHSMAATQYSLRDLGKLTDLAQRVQSGPHAINNRGDVAAVNALGNAYHALLYSGTSWKDLSTLGGSESYASGLNNLGQVVGYALTASGEKHAFLWTPGATDGAKSNPQMKDLGAIVGGESEAFDINNAGDVCGYLVSGKQAQAFIYSKGKTLKLESPLNGLPNTFAYSINDSGHAAGTLYSADYGNTRAFIYNGVNSAVLTAPGDADATALAISETDAVAGYFTTGKSERAFKYIGGKVTDLGTLGGHFSYGLAINKANVIVGGSFVDSQDSVYHAFIAENESMADLNTRLNASGSGWTLTEAFGINDAGQIVGVGFYKSEVRVFVLDPMNQIIDPVRAGVRIQGQDVVVSFGSTAGVQYRVQSSSTILGPWTDLVTGIAGTGSGLSVTNRAAATQTSRFYRISTAAF